MAISAEQFQALLRRAPHIVERAVGPALFAAGQEIAIEAQISITTGAVSGANHVASAPGEAPNNDTSVLANNIEVVQGNNKSTGKHNKAAVSTGAEVYTGDLKAEVSSNAPYSAALEFGTSRIAARPFMRPAAIKETPTARKLVERAVKRAMRDVLKGVR